VTPGDEALALEVGQNISEEARLDQIVAVVDVAEDRAVGRELAGIVDLGVGEDERLALGSQDQSFGSPLRRPDVVRVTVLVVQSSQRRALPATAGTHHRSRRTIRVGRQATEP